MIATGKFAQDIILHALPAVAGNIGGVYINANLGMRFKNNGHSGFSNIRSNEIVFHSSTIRMDGLNIMTKSLPSYCAF
jgi:hypothetical protein